MRTLPATFLRGGTSKGLFVLSSSLLNSSAALPFSQLASKLLGSPDPYGRQLDGLGGGSSSTSKIIVVSEPPSDIHADLSYTFHQVPLHSSALPANSGNCGNLTAAVPIFALDENVCRVGRSDRVKGFSHIRCWNTNTQKMVVVGLPINRETGLAETDEEQVSIPGVPGLASRIEVEFLKPAGAATGKLLPTGSPRDKLKRTGADVTCVDSTNPTVILRVPSLSLEDSVSNITAEFLEHVRREAAEKMGLDPKVQAQPKICMAAKSGHGEQSDWKVKTMSMGVMHRAIPGTVALAFAAACAVKGSVVEMATGMRDGDRRISVRVSIPPGKSSDVLEAWAKFEGDEVKSVGLVRTARRLMRGEVFINHAA